MSATPYKNEDFGDFITSEWMEQRAADLVAMNANALTRNSGAFDDAGLAEYLNGAQMQGEGDGFDGFSILFGVDKDGQDFVVVKSATEGSLHFVLTTDGGSAQ